MSSILKGNLKRVEKGYISELETILKDISYKYRIYDKNTDMFLSEEDLINIYITPMIEQEKQYQCSAILLNGNRCSHKSLKETRYRYCKKHLFKDNQTNLLKQSFTQKDMNYKDETNEYIYGINHVTNVTSIENSTYNINNLTENIDTLGLIQHFIDDKLYYIDDKYIYNCDGVSKAGYLEKDDTDVNYILIDDPFILQNI